MVLRLCQCAQQLPTAYMPRPELSILITVKRNATKGAMLMTVRQISLIKSAISCSNSNLTNQFLWSETTAPKTPIQWNLIDKETIWNQLRWMESEPVNGDEGFWNHAKDGTPNIGSKFDLGGSNSIVEQWVGEWGHAQQSNSASLMNPPTLLCYLENCCFLWVLLQPCLYTVVQCPPAYPIGDCLAYCGSNHNYQKPQSIPKHHACQPHRWSWWKQKDWKDGHWKDQNNCQHRSSEFFWLPYK